MNRAFIIAALSEALSLSPEYAQVLAILLELPVGEEVTVNDLGLAISTHRPPTHGALYERVSQLRKALGVDAIAGLVPAAKRTTRSGFSGSTYRLSTDGRRICNNALAGIGARLSKGYAA